MYMELNINIHSIEIEITAVARQDNILAFVDWIFKTDIGDMKLKGGTIRRKEFKSKTKLSFDVPAIRSKGGFIKAFFLDNKKVFLQLCAATVKKYCEETGELFEDFSHYEEVNPDDIPF